MSNVVMLLSFKLKNDVSVQDFLLASDKTQNDYLSKCKGYVSRKLFVNDEIWTDLVFWETMDDAEKAMNASEENASVKGMSSLIAEIIQYTLAPLERNY